MLSLRDLAEQALAVQDACNLSGVVHGFARAMTDLCNLGLDTSARNRHPITILWVDKLAHLSGYKQDCGPAVMNAYRDVRKLAESDEMPRCVVDETAHYRCVG